MSHGECDDWWDFFDCPLWVALYLNETRIIDMDKATSTEDRIKLREVVDYHYQIMKKHEEKFLYEGGVSIRAIKLK